MDFLERIKNDMLEERNRRGMREKVIVDSTALRMLLESYEELDSYERIARADRHANLEARLSEVLRALYAESHDSERLMLLVMDILKPMIARRIKEQGVDYIYGLSGKIPWKK